MLGPHIERMEWRKADRTCCYAVGRDPKVGVANTKQLNIKANYS